MEQVDPDGLVRVISILTESIIAWRVTEQTGVEVMRDLVKMCCSTGNQSNRDLDYELVTIVSQSLIDQMRYLTCSLLAE